MTEEILRAEPVPVAAGAGGDGGDRIVAGPVAAAIAMLQERHRELAELVAEARSEDEF